jgi:hypothetical protein
MAGQSRPKDGVAPLAQSRQKDGVASLAQSRQKDGVASLAYDSAIHGSGALGKKERRGCAAQACSRAGQKPDPVGRA